MIKKEDIDLKWIFIFILGGILIFKTFFGGNNEPIDNQQEEVDRLTNENLLLQDNYDSLGLVIDSVNERIIVIDADLVATKDELNKKNNEIDELKERRYEISNYVKSLHADSIAPVFTNYLQRRGGSNN